jgi:DNA-binding transcriptional ArsR family regulator
MDTVLRAIADPKRRDIIRLVWARELAAAEIADYFPDVTRSAISQHLSVLKRNGILQERREGTRRLYIVNRGEIVKLRAFLDSFWSDSLERLRDLAEATQRNKETP